MLPTHILFELRRRPWTRRTLSLAGYAGGVLLFGYGVVAFWATDLDGAMASGFALVGGMIMGFVTSEIREAIHALPVTKSDTIES